MAAIASASDPPTSQSLVIDPTCLQSCAECGCAIRFLTFTDPKGGTGLALLPILAAYTDGSTNTTTGVIIPPSVRFYHARCWDNMVYTPPATRVPPTERSEVHPYEHNHGVHVVRNIDHRDLEFCPVCNYGLPATASADCVVDLSPDAVRVTHKQCDITRPILVHNASMRHGTPYFALIARLVQDGAFGASSATRVTGLCADAIVATGVAGDSGDTLPSALLVCHPRAEVRGRAPYRRVAQFPALHWSTECFIVALARSPMRRVAVFTVPSAELLKNLLETEHSAVLRVVHHDTRADQQRVFVLFNDPPAPLAAWAAYAADPSANPHPLAHVTHVVSHAARAHTTQVPVQYGVDFCITPDNFVAITDGVLRGPGCHTMSPFPAQVFAALRKM